MGPWTSQQSIIHRHAASTADLNEGEDDSSSSDGVDADGAESMSEASVGVIPRAFRHIFKSLRKRKRNASRESSDDKETVTCPYDFSVKLQFLELYGEEIRDLLASGTGSNRDPSKSKLSIRDGGTDDPEVVGATQTIVTTAEEALHCLTRGNLHRVTAATAMNETSSRSHAILTVMVEQSTVLEDPSSPIGTRVLQSKFNFVDLAGSERVKRTQAEGKRLKEGIDINKGLLVLGNVISALGDPAKRGRTFVPYRDSKLTRLLQGSLGGNHKTLMMACVSPASSNLDESLNCLRYANRAKNIQNRAVVNVDATSKLISDLQGQVRVLASDLLQVCYSPGQSGAGGLTHPISFGKEALVTLAAGGTVNVFPSGNVADPGSFAAAGAANPVAFAGLTDNTVSLKRVEDLEIELSRTQSRLAESRKNHDLAEEELYLSKAERSLFELQVEVLTENKHSMFSQSELSESFVRKATEYEKEIRRLRDELRKSEARSTAIDSAGGFSVEMSLKELQDQTLLSTLEAAVENDLAKFGVSDAVATNDGDDVALGRELDHTEEEESITDLTNKYLIQGGSDDVVGKPLPSAEVVLLGGKSRLQADRNVAPSDKRRKHQLQMDLMELSKSIAVKEELIDQLKLSQEKYAVSEERRMSLDVALQWAPNFRRAFHRTFTRA
jgi:Kinesin motor domain